jgi:hypothetical protein
MSLISDVREDAQYKKFVVILGRTKERLKLEEALQEALGLHTSRTSRHLTGNDRYSPRKLIDASMRDLSTRARLVEIRVTNDRNLSHLREAMDALRRYISTEYADDLRDFSTADQRRAFVDRILKSANELLAEGESVLSSIDYLIKDIDQSGHSMRHVVDCLKLLENKHGSKVV